MILGHLLGSQVTGTLAALLRTTWGSPRDCGQFTDQVKDLGQDPQSKTHQGFSYRGIKGLTNKWLIEPFTARTSLSDISVTRHQRVPTKTHTISQGPWANQGGHVSKFSKFLA